MEYNLSASITHHKGNLRTVCCNGNGLVLTGSFDKTCAFFNYVPEQNTYVFRNSTEYHNDYIYCVRSSVDNRGFFSGSKDKQIIFMDNEGNPMAEFLEHEGTVNCIDQNPSDPNHFASGSWDATAKIWDLVSMKSIYTLFGHSHAVSVLSLPGDKYITGSQDKNLNFWDKGKLIKTINNAHNDIIRSIILAPDGNSFYTTSNDQSIKQWSFNGNIINILNDAHSAFIFGLNYNTKTNQLVSCGDDCLVKLWNVNGSSNCLIHPRTVWDVSVNPLNGDILSACGDGILRVWSNDSNRWLNEQSLNDYQKLCEMSQSSENESNQKEQNEVEIQKLTPIEQMPSITNVKEGEIRLFNNNGKGEAYMFQGGSWQLIGEVLGKKNDKRYFEGDSAFPAGEYDYVFDVELEGGLSKLPFNEGGNALIAAEKFVAREKLHKGYVDDIRKFLRDNTGRNKKANNVINEQREKPKGNTQRRNETKNVKPLINFSFPNLNFYSYDNINQEGAFKKIAEINNNFPEGSPEKLIEIKLKQVLNACKTACQKEMYHASTFNEYEIAEYFQLIPKWKDANAIPIFDVFRMFLLHPQCNEILKKTGNGIGEMALILEYLQKNESPVKTALFLRVLNNYFWNELPRNTLCSRKDKILEVLSNFLDSDNKNVRNALCNIFFNMSITLVNKTNETDAVMQLLAGVNELIQTEKNSDNLINLLKCLANLFIGSEENRTIGKDMDIGNAVQNIKPEEQDENVENLKNYVIALLS
ncbi:MAG: WD repeat PLAP family protein [archaeon]|nr:WD repeat PLAP family protein [archaeon]